LYLTPGDAELWRLHDLAFLRSPMLMLLRSNARHLDWPSRPSRPGVMRAFVPVFLMTMPLLALRSQAPTARAVTGTYALGTREPFSPGRDGCWLEVAPVTTDSLRVQFLCRHPGPGHHLGELDTRLPFQNGSVTYQADGVVGHCKIVVTFAPPNAVVTNEGGDVSPDRACGFGAYVDLSGTYRRLNAQRPSFDLGPIERPQPPRGELARRPAPSRRLPNER
jgi:hypothetical protein